MATKQETDAIIQGNTFDDVFRTIVQKLPQLMIPLINKVFHTKYSEDEKFIQLRNEYMEEYGKIITDSIFVIQSKTYHIECQSTDDNTMAIRMMEYDFSIALEQAHKSKRSYEINFPETCVLYLRDSNSTPDTLEVIINFPNGKSATYQAKTFKLSRYTSNDIFQKRLFCLLPFYILKYEKNKSALSHNSKLLNEMLAEMETIRRKMEIIFEAEEASNIYTDLIDLIIRISDYIFAKESDIKEGVEHIMGGQVLELFSERCLAEGITEGGIKERICTLLEFGKTKEECIADIITRYQLTPDQAEEYFTKYAPKSKI